MTTNDTAPASATALPASTSLRRLLDALDAHGWSYTVEEFDGVRMPKPKDPNSNHRRRSRWDAYETVPGFAVHIDNGVTPDQGTHSLYTHLVHTIYFDANGRFSAKSTGARYPFDGSFTNVLDAIAKYSRAEHDKRAQRQRDYEATQTANERIKVADHYQRSSTELATARANLRGQLDSLGLSDDQAAAVIGLAAEADGPFSRFLAAHATLLRASRGEGVPGLTVRRLTYRNGAPVEETP